MWKLFNWFQFFFRNGEQTSNSLELMSISNLVEIVKCTSFYTLSSNLTIIYIVYSVLYFNVALVILNAIRVINFHKEIKIRINIIKKSSEKNWTKFRCLEESFKWFAPLVSDKYSNHQMAFSIGCCFIPDFINLERFITFLLYLKSTNWLKCSLYNFCY